MAKQTINKSRAAKEALAELGPDVKPGEVRNWVLNKYGLEITLNYISNIKSAIGQKGPKKTTAVRGRAEAKVALSTPPAAQKQAGSIMLEDVQAVKQLAQRVGIDKLHRLINVLQR